MPKQLVYMYLLYNLLCHFVEFVQKRRRTRLILHENTSLFSSDLVAQHFIRVGYRHCHLATKTEMFAMRAISRGRVLGTYASLSF